MQAKTKARIEEKVFINGLPCDTDTERAVVICMTIDQTCIEEALDLDIGDGHFYDIRYRVIYNKIVEIRYNEAANVDLLLLKTKLRDCEEFRKYDDSDIVDFLAEFDATAILPANFRHYIERLEDFKQRRKNVLDSARSVEAAYDFSVPVATDITSRKDSIRRFDIATCLSTPPPPRKWVFRDFLPQGIVAALSGAGGTGKSKFVLYAAVSAATEMRVFDCFRPEVARPVICWFGEDSEQIIWERLRCIVDSCEGIDAGLLNENLNIYCEQAMPLMELEYNKPVRTDAYRWLKRKIAELKPGLIVIDPKSKFYGLPEDCNTSAAIWLNHIQELIVNIDATILVSHHVSKARTHFLDSSSSRGASAFIDGCRWAANIKVMDEDTGAKLEVDNHKSYIEMLVTKSNYTALPSEPLRFRHVAGGGLEQVQLEQKRMDGIVSLICDALRMNPHKLLSANEIARKKDGNFIREIIKKEIGRTTRKDIRNAIIYGLQSNIFHEVEISTNTNKKLVVCIT